MSAGLKRTRLEIVLQNSAHAYVEWNLLSAVDKQNERTSRGFGHGHFVKNIWIMAAQKRDEQVVTENVIVHMLGDRSWPRLVIRADRSVSRFLCCRLDDEVEYVISVLSCL